MKSLLLLVLFITFGTAKTVPFSSENGEYTFEINENYEYSRSETTEGGFTDMLSVKEDGKTVYSMVVVKADLGMNFPLAGFKTKEFKDSYLSSCQCKISAEKDMKYKNFDAVKLTIKMKELELKGDAINISKDKYIYNITFLATEDNYKKYKDDFETLLNTMKIN